METIWEIKLSAKENGCWYRVTCRGPEGKRTGDGPSPEAAFAQCIAGYVYKPAFGPNWQLSPRG